ncbi:tetrathionate reductase subunit B [Salmonella enterica subsp. enterica serovar Madelia]|nr:tetrathionate reductase subunit B [Salmonella enterica subsp. enterica serovar Madelia]
MDSSKRLFLQQLGVLTAGASLVPLAEAKFPFSPERHEGSPRHRYAMLIDLRRCIGCQSCTVSCTIENQTPQGAFRTMVNQYQVQREGSQEVTNVLLPRLCNHCDNPPVCRSARYKPPFSGKTALWWWITNAASAAPIVSRRVLTTLDLSIMKRKLPINARFASIVWKPGCYPLA